jgi:hypothetical protein
MGFPCRFATRKHGQVKSGSRKVEELIEFQMVLISRDLKSACELMVLTRG